MLERMEEFTDMLVTSYEASELVVLFEVDAAELVAMLRDAHPEKFEANIYKIEGGYNND